MTGVDRERVLRLKHVQTEIAASRKAQGLRTDPPTLTIAGGMMYCVDESRGDVVLAAAALACRHAARLRALTAAIAGTTFLQVGVGVANVLWALPVEVTALHSALACALVLALAAANREALLASRATPSGAPPGEPC